MSGGTLTGSESLTVSGATTWTGGTMTGTGVTNASGGLTIGGTAANTNYQVQLTRTLNNPGTGQIERSITGGGFSTTLFIDSGGTLDNQPGASFAFTDDDTNVTFASGSGGVIIGRSRSRNAIRSPASRPNASPRMVNSTPGRSAPGARTGGSVRELSRQTLHLHHAPVHQSGDRYPSGR